MTFEELMRDHDHIDQLTQDLEDLCTAPTHSVEAVCAARDTLRSALQGHLFHEDEALYSRLMLSNKQSADAVANFDQAFEQLKADWAEYLEDWNEECVEADWDGFRGETIALMARVRARTRAETNLLYPLALQQGSVQLRAAGGAAVTGR